MDGPLARHIGRHRRSRVDRADRAGQDQPALLPRRHLLRRRLAEHPDRGQIGLQDAPEVGELELGGRLAMIDAGVGDEDVEAAVTPCEIGDAAVRGVAVGDVERAGLGRQLLGGEFGDPGRQRLLVARIERHVGTRLGERFSHRPAESPGRAGDERDLAGQVKHGRPPGSPI